MAEPSAHKPPPGWYDDPHTAHWLRYWDGDQWTDHESPKHNLKPLNPQAAKSNAKWALGLTVVSAVGATFLILFTFLRFIGYFGDSPLGLVASVPAI